MSTTYQEHANFKKVSALGCRVGLFIAGLSKFGNVHYSLRLLPLWGQHPGEEQLLPILEATQTRERRAGNAGAKDARKWGREGHSCGEAGLSKRTRSRKSWLVLSNI